MLTPLADRPPSPSRSALLWVLSAWDSSCRGLLGSHACPRGLWVQASVWLPPLPCQQPGAHPRCAGSPGPWFLFFLGSTAEHHLSSPGASCWCQCGPALLPSDPSRSPSLSVWLACHSLLLPFAQQNFLVLVTPSVSFVTFLDVLLPGTVAFSVCP